MALVPVDYDPFADDGAPNPLAATTPSPALPGQGPWYGRLWDVAKGAGEAIAGDIGDLASGVAQTAAIPGDVYAGRIAAGSPEAEEAARQFASTFGMGGAPGGAVASGISRRALGGALDTPIEDAAAQRAFADELRAQHLARGDDGLPLLGAKQPVTPPPHVQSAADMSDAVNRYADLAMTGMPWRDWYLVSGRGILGAAGGDPERAEKLIAAAAQTSKATDVASNLTSAVTMYNQAMLGDPIWGGRFPNTMSPEVEKYLYGGEPVTGPKIKPFQGAIVQEWNPDFEHTYVNDIWNMRALGYPGSVAPTKMTNEGWYGGTPTMGQHNFARIVADQATDELNRRTGLDWTPKQAQAAAWVATKSQMTGMPLADAAANFADGLKNNYAQLSWESAPGMTTNNLPEFHDADPAVRQAYHDAIRNVLVDDQGRDIIAQHLGLLTGSSFEAPGVYRGAVNPGTQSQVVLGQSPGGWAKGIDPASKELASAGEAVRGLLLRQDAVAYHKPTYVGGPALDEGATRNLANLVDVDLGRPLTLDEARAVTQAMSDAAGAAAPAEFKNDAAGFFSPIGTPSGFRFMNRPDVTGLTNPQFQEIAKGVVGSDILPGTAQFLRAHADGDYIANDWSKNPNGENYFGSLGRTGRPDLQRAAAQLLATLGPRVAQVEDDFAKNYGWTPDRATRVWENPIIEQYGGGVVPSPPKPWQQRPAPPGSGPSLFSPTGPPDPRALRALAHGAGPRLVPVDYDPFAGEGAR